MNLVNLVNMFKVYFLYKRNIFFSVISLNVKSHALYVLEADIYGAPDWFDTFLYLKY